MRTLRVSLAGMAMSALLGGVGGADLAQDEPVDPMAPAAVTGTVELGTETRGTWSIDAGVERTEGRKWTLSYDASDPRLDGTAYVHGNLVGVPLERIYVGAATRVLVNDDGRWVGTDTELVAPGASMEFIIMRGEDAYEGLTAVIVEDWSDLPRITFDGAIVPGELRFPEAWAGD